MISFRTLFPHRVASAALIACASVGTASAQGTPLAQPPIIVTANPLGNIDAPAPTERVEGTELKLRSPASLGDALDGLAGVSSSGFAPAAGRPVIRGLDGERIRILRNGAASLDASGLSADHAVPINLLAVKSIEVVRGPAALLYGGNAIGGVVNVQDGRIHAKSPFKGAHMQASGGVEAQWASADASRGLAAAVDLGNQTFSAHVDAAQRRAKDTKAPFGLSCLGKLQQRICNSAAKSDEAAFGGQVQLGEWQLGASFSQYDSRYGAVAEDEVTIGMKQSRSEWLAVWQPAAASGSASWVKRWRTHASQSDYAHTEFEGPDVGTKFTNKGHSLRSELVLHPFTSDLGGVEAVVGFQADLRRFSADGEEAFAPYSRAQDRAGFGLVQLNSALGQFSAGMHAQHSVIESLGHPSLARFATGQRKFSPRNTALAWVSPRQNGWQWRANVASAQRAPADAELYANGPHLATSAYEVGDDTLGLERGRHMELGLLWRAASGSTAQAQMFRTAYSAHIAWMPTGRTRSAEGEIDPDPATVDEVLPEWMVRAVPARFSGWEAQGIFKLTQAWALNWRADRVTATNNATGEALPRIAPTRFGLTAVWQRGATSARLGLDRFSAQRSVPVDAAPVAGYNLWHAAITQEQQWAQRELLWFAKLDNARNARAFSATSILTQTAPGRQPLAGRSLRAGVQLAW